MVCLQTFRQNLALKLEVGLRLESAKQPYLVKSSSALVRGVLLSAEPPEKASELYRGLTVPVNGEKTWSEYGARVPSAGS
jgi:hypothetical protein